MFVWFRIVKSNCSLDLWGVAHWIKQCSNKKKLKAFSKLWGEIVIKQSPDNIECMSILSISGGHSFYVSNSKSSRWSSRNAGNSNNALCVYPHCKVSIGQYTKMCTSPLIFFQLHYFRCQIFAENIWSLSLSLYIWPLESWTIIAIIRFNSILKRFGDELNVK